MIANDVVLTAAHCVVGRNPAGVAVIADAANLCRDSATLGSREAVNTISIDPRYDPRTGAFDIAKLQLEDNVEFTRKVAPLDDQAADELPATVLGWGAVTPGGPSSCQLMRISVHIVDPSNCVSALEGTANHLFSPTSMLCAVPDDPTADVCNGDSGGPMILGTDLDSGPVVGIVSWGQGCGGSLGPMRERS
jgi:trypsin